MGDDFKKELQNLGFDDYTEGELMPWEYMEQYEDIELAQRCGCGGCGGRGCGGRGGGCFRRCGGCSGCGCGGCFPFFPFQEF
jgi:heterocycloanthracin/sonorensin family bacteriocin